MVDGLQNNGFKDKVVIANPAKMDQYSGMKNSNDKSDAFFIAELMRLEILPTGYICDKESRAVRDILRRRSLFVKQCTAQKLSLQNMVSRQCGQTMSMREMHKLTDDEWAKILVSKDNFFMAKQNVDMIRFLTEKIKILENHVLKQAKLKPEFEKLLTAPGIGNILGLTIMYETCDISRFAKAGNFTSYCRCVKAEAQSNGKKKGYNNRKNGNKFLSWAMVEAANMMRRFCPEAQSYYDKKRKLSGNNALATKSLAAKISKAVFYILKNQEDFDVKKIFG